MLPKSNVHSHTTYVDGKNSPEEMVRAALALGFHTLGFSEHGCAEYDDCSLSPDREPLYRAEILGLREKYAGQIDILLGYEHDWFAPPSALAYDYFIESVHYLPGGDGLWSVDWTRPKQEEAIARFYGGDAYAMCRHYFRTVCESIEGTAAQILGHIELVMKFNEARDIFDDADPRYLKPALEAAELAARSGKIIEINTGAIGRGYRTQPCPGPAMLKRIRECGGRIMLSSDCHDARYLDCGFDAAAALALACGFETAWEYRGAALVEYPLQEGCA